MADRKNPNLIELGRNEKGRFMVGFIPWNKGKVGWNAKEKHPLWGKTRSKEVREKMSKGMKGRKPWNKGVPNSAKTRKKISKALEGHTPWNKGKKRPEISGENHPMYGKKHTKKAIKTMSKSWFKKGLVPWNKGGGKQIGVKGKDNHFWKGGITPLTKRIRMSLKYRQWRSDVFTRDNFTCQPCQQRGGKLRSHHIKPFSKIMEENKILTFKQAMNCEELWNINNGVTYCEECHQKTDNYGGKSAKR